MNIGKLIGAQQLEGVLFDGEWISAVEITNVVEPATGTTLGRLGSADPSVVRKKAAAARDNQLDWARRSADDRAGILRRAAEAAELHSETIIEWLVREAGSTRTKAGFELAVTIKALRLAGAMPHEAQGLVLPSEAGTLSLARRKPLGVVGVIAPFNFPLYLAMRAVAPALAVGNAVILKPDPRTGICGGFVIARLFELAGLPAGVLHVLPGGGDAGEALCSDPNVAMIQFTGSTNAGRSVGRTASEHLKKVSLELGGKNALIICEDADLDLAVRNAAWGTFLHQGQICMAAGRVLVHATLIDAFAQKLAEHAEALLVGNPVSAEVAVGPIINQRQLDHALSIIKQSVDSGAVLLSGGTADGLFLKPAVLSRVDRTMAAYDTEIFAPVAVLIPFNNDDEAVKLANDTEYGLSLGIITNDVARGLSLGERVNTGIVHVNDQTVNDDVVNPFGGFGASGNGSSIGGPANWEEFTQWQWTTVKASPPPYSF